MHVRVPGGGALAPEEVEVAEDGDLARLLQENRYCCVWDGACAVPGPSPRVWATRCLLLPAHDDGVSGPCMASWRSIKVCWRRLLHRCAARRPDPAAHVASTARLPVLAKCRPSSSRCSGWKRTKETLPIASSAHSETCCFCEVTSMPLVSGLTCLDEQDACLASDCPDSTHLALSYTVWAVLESSALDREVKASVSEQQASKAALAAACSMLTTKVSAVGRCPLPAPCTAVSTVLLWQRCDRNSERATMTLMTHSIP